MQRSINASVNSQWHNLRFLLLFFYFKYSFRFYSTLQAKCTMWFFLLCILHFKCIHYRYMRLSHNRSFQLGKEASDCFWATYSLFFMNFEQLSFKHFFLYLDLNRLQKCFIFIGQFVIVLKRKWRIFVDTWQPHWNGVFVLYIRNNVNR